MNTSDPGQHSQIKRVANDSVIITKYIIYRKWNVIGVFATITMAVNWLDENFSPAEQSKIAMIQESLTD